MAEASCSVTECESVAALPEPARALFGGDAFSTLAWYGCTAAHALLPGQSASFQVVAQGSEVMAVLPMLREAGRLAALTTPYTVLWSPLLRAGLADTEIIQIGRALGRAWRGGAVIRLDAVQGGAAWLAPLLSGLRGAGLLALRFDHFGNWHVDVGGQGWDAYLAARPGELRSSVKRRSKHFLGRQGAAFSLITEAAEIERGLAAYDRVYAASWKTPEPCPAFNPALMRAACGNGSLRLGVLWLGGEPVAVQYWLVHGGWAGVQKLAHAEQHRQSAPGTVLTGLMIRHLLEVDRVAELDFGRGDDGYKRLWTGQRRQRVGVLLVAPWRVDGAAALLRHEAGRLRARVAAQRSRADAGP